MWAIFKVSNHTIIHQSFPFKPRFWSEGWALPMQSYGSRVWTYKVLTQNCCWIQMLRWITPFEIWINYVFIIAAKSDIEPFAKYYFFASVERKKRRCSVLCAVQCSTSVSTAVSVPEGKTFLLLPSLRLPVLWDMTIVPHFILLLFVFLFFQKCPLVFLLRLLAKWHVQLLDHGLEALSHLVPLCL